MKFIYRRLPESMQIGVKEAFIAAFIFYVALFVGLMV